ncbi:MAG: ATP synthase F1 subunit gamma [Verrucomicrobia bacterium]|nr:ATP synthase F1 subunit gamma [Verrucomicrobiota bacterium]MBV9671615.1 ATP synthase F1 subunit gamma [Verrucomicrobiota bacterium]
MPSTLDLRRRIKSVKNTSQITKAMQMVAAAKMRKAQTAALAGRPYEDALGRVAAAVKGKVDPAVNPLLAERPMDRELILIFATDKGLCGPLNTNLFREILKLERDSADYASAGRKAVQFLARTRRNLIASFEVGDQPRFAEIRPIAKFLTEKFVSSEVDRVRVLYPRFVNTLTQQPIMRTLLPISPEELGVAGPENTGEFLFEPSAAGVLNALLPHYLAYELYEMALNARASEHSARMVAMKTATDNAKQLIKDLTLEYNKARQENITTELLEIATAQLAG